MLRGIFFTIQSIIWVLLGDSSPNLPIIQEPLVRQEGMPGKVWPPQMRNIPLGRERGFESGVEAIFTWVIFSHYVLAK